MRRLAWIDFTVGGACVALALVTIWLNTQSPVAGALLRGQRVSGLLIGSDYEDNTRHSDTLMYVSYDPQSRFLDVLSIPRDTQVSLKELPSIRRINEIFAYEFHHSGRDFDIASMALKSFVGTLLSSGSASGLQIPFYFTIDYRSFRLLIDALGGIFVRVTEPMNYDDNWGHLHIHFEPGTYLMNGHTALEYVRFRGSNADQGRVMRQQIFVKDVLKRLKSPVVLWSFPKYAQAVLGGLHTNFSTWDLVSILVESRRMNWKKPPAFCRSGRALRRALENESGKDGAYPLAHAGTGFAQRAVVTEEPEPELPRNTGGPDGGSLERLQSPANDSAGGAAAAGQGV